MVPFFKAGKGKEATDTTWFVERLRRKEEPTALQNGKQTRRDKEGLNLVSALRQVHPEGHSFTPDSLCRCW